MALKMTLKMALKMNEYLNWQLKLGFLSIRKKEKGLFVNVC